MKKIILALLTVTSSAAFAGSINLDARVDSDSANYNKDNGNANYSKFTLQTGRVDYKGKASEDLSFRLRLRFNQTQSAVNTRDSLNSAVDYASITHKMGDAALTAGKFDIMTNGFEGATAGSDMYFTSLAYSAYGRYHTGFNVNYTMGDHGLTVLAVNNKSDTTSGQSRNMYGLIYKGSLMDKTLGLMGSYHVLSVPYTDAAEVKNNNDSYATVGVQYKMDAWAASLDYNMISTIDTTAAKKDSTDSIVLAGAFALDEVIGFKAKVESSTEKDAAANDAKTTTLGYGLAAEFKPIKDVDFRYHVAYTNKDVKPETGATRTESHIIAGLKINADFLK